MEKDVETEKKIREGWYMEITKVEDVGSDIAPVCAPAVSIACENNEGRGQGEKPGSSPGHMHLCHPIFPRKACAAQWAGSSNFAGKRGKLEKDGDTEKRVNEGVVK